MGKKNSGKAKESIREIKGILDITKSGMGFVISDETKKDILVKPQDFNRAFDGDTVLVRLKKSDGKRAEGKIVTILERKQNQFIGGIEVNENFAFFVPAGEKPIPDFHVDLDKLNGAKNGDRVVVKFLNWDNENKKPEAEVVQVLEAKNESDMAMKEIIIQNGFPLSFPKEVIDAANALSANVEEELPSRKDYRNVLTFTIDPMDAKDFDDAISFKKVENNLFEIGVHIADVSHFVIPGSVLDEAAYKRATSVYLPDRVIPMLPEKISNDLCSLRPHEDKFCFSAIFSISGNGKVKDSWLGRTIIHSDHRFAYEEVQEIIEKKEGPYHDEILKLNQIAQTFRQERFAKGAINFSSSEVKFRLDENGKPIEVIVKESKPSHQLVEEFMLLANRTVAAYVAKVRVHNEPIPFPYRVHDTPDEEKLKPFVAFARKFGYKFNMNDEKAIADSFNQLMMDVRGKPEQHVLEQLGIRTMAKAVYDVDNIGHYGLGFKDYCHFTSPIRRYPDIMAHRVLQQILSDEIVIDKKMEAKCVHCSGRERAAMEAERAGNKYKQVEFMLDKVGEEMDGVISGVSAFGFWVETVKEKCEGLVSIKDLTEYDEFRHDEADFALIGLNTGKKFRMGDTVRVLLVAANLEKRQLDFDWIPDKMRTPKKKTNRGKK